MTAHSRHASAHPSPVWALALLATVGLTAGQVVVDVTLHREHETAIERMETARERVALSRAELDVVQQLEQQAIATVNELTVDVADLEATLAAGTRSSADAS